MVRFADLHAASVAAEAAATTGSATAAQTSVNTMTEFGEAAAGFGDALSGQTQQKQETLDNLVDDIRKGFD